MQQIPGAQELIGAKIPDLDEEYVLEHFLGKSQAQARDFFDGRGHFITEDFAWMKPDGLRFYLPPFLDYLEWETGQRDTEAAHGILCSLSSQIQQHTLPDDVLIVAKQIAAYIKQHCKRFGIEPRDELYRGCLKIIEGASNSRRA